MIKKIIAGVAIIAISGCAQDNPTELEGKITVKGSSPHTYLCIHDTKRDKTYKIKNKTDFGLMQRQNQIIKLDVIQISKEKGPGFPALVEVMGVR